MTSWILTLFATIIVLIIAIFTQKNTTITFGQVTVSIIWSILLFGFGTILQSVISDIFWTATYGDTLLFRYVNNPTREFLHNLRDIVISGMIPGAIVSLLVLRTRLGTSFITIFATSLITLATNDLFEFAFNAYFRGEIPYAKNVFFSLVCDVFGSIPLALIVKHSFSIIQNKELILQKYTGIKTFITVSVCGLIVTSMILIIGFYPLPTHIALKLKSFSDLYVSYGVNIDGELQSPPDQQLMMSSDLSIVPLGTSISMDINQNITKSQGLKMVSLIGCHSPEEAIETAKSIVGNILPVRKDPVKFDVKASELRVWILNKKPLREINFLTFNANEPVNITPNINNSGRIFQFGLDSILNVYATSAHNVVFSSESEIFNDKLSVHLDGKTIESIQYEKCSIGTKIDKENNRKWIVLTAQNNDDYSSLKIHTGIDHILLPFNVGINNDISSIIPSRNYQYINLLKGKVNDGTLISGTSTQQISQETDIFLKSKAAFIVRDNSKGELTIDGESTYASINGHLLNSSLISSISDVWLTPLIGAILAALGVPLLAYWKKISEK